MVRYRYMIARREAIDQANLPWVASLALLWVGTLLLLVGASVASAQEPPRPERDLPGVTDEASGVSAGDDTLAGAQPTGSPTTAPSTQPVGSARRETLPGFYPEALGLFKGKGVWVGTPDRRYILRMSGFIHFDTKYSASTDGAYKRDQIFLRRARVALDGRFLGDFEYRLMWDNMIDPLVPYDWHIDWRPRKEVNLRVGGFKDPFSLERRMRSFALLFMERSFTNSLSPNRGMGAFVYGQTDDGFFSYEAALTSGAANGERRYYWRGTPDFAGRVYFLPFRRLVPESDALHHLGVGASWTVGEDFGDAQRTGLGNVATPARGQRLLGYAGGEDPVVVNGLRDRQALQLHWQYRRWQAMAELTRSAHRVSHASVARRDRNQSAYLANHAWHVLASFTHNRHDENRFYGVSPARPLSVREGQWGGFTSAIRYTQLLVDPDTYPLFADPDSSVRGAHGLTYSLQWHINSTIEAQADVDVSVPVGGGGSTGNLPVEVSAGTRVEYRY